MPRGANGIATRQHAEGLFFVVEPLEAAEEIVSPVFKTAGFAALVVSGFSDQPYTVLLHEANRPEGPFTPLPTLSSAPVSGVERMAEKVTPVGGYMRATVNNPSVAQNFFSLVIYGTPS